MVGNLLQKLGMHCTQYSRSYVLVRQSDVGLLIYQLMARASFTKSYQVQMNLAVKPLRGSTPEGCSIGI